MYKTKNDFSQDDLSRILKDVSAFDMNIQWLDGTKPCHFSTPGIAGCNCHGKAVKKICIPKQKNIDRLLGDTYVGEYELCKLCFQDITGFTKPIGAYAPYQIGMLQEIKKVYKENNCFYDNNQGDICNCDVCGDKTWYHINMRGFRKNLCPSCLVQVRTTVCRDCGREYVNPRFGIPVCPQCSDRIDREVEEEERRRQERQDGWRYALVSRLKGDGLRRDGQYAYPDHAYVDSCGTIQVGYGASIAHNWLHNGMHISELG